MVVMREFDFTRMIKRLSYVADLGRSGGELDALVNKTMGEVVSSPAGQKGMGLVQLLPPSHTGVNGEAAGAHGEAVVRSDILKVYATPNSLFADLQARNPQAARGFIAAINNRPTKSGRSTGPEAARKIVQSTLGYGGITIDAFDGGALHRQLRSRSTGRVVNKRPLTIVTNPEALESYIEGKQKNVGLMASAATRAGLMFGASNIPEFILRHGTKFSAIQIVRTSTAYWVISDSLVPFGQSEIARRIPYALRYRYRALGVTIGLLVRDRLNQSHAKAA